MNCYTDVERFRLETGATSVMVARAAMWNPSVFSRKGVEPLDDVIRNYLKYVSRCFLFFPFFWDIYSCRNVVSVKHLISI